MQSNKLIPILVIFAWAGLMYPISARAVTSPIDTQNNYFGIHITQESDIPKAAELVNSSGGDWGYVTFVIREDERNVDQWQHTFDELRRHHLIPIVRIATKMNQDSWERPHSYQADEWIGFLNSLNWVVKNRYVILFNEPNHAKEWGNDIKPEEYVEVAKTFAQKLKQAEADYFILPAALDAAASDGSSTMSSVRFMSIMYDTDPEFFSLFDGWNSHAYPNPGFSGQPWDYGLATIRGFAPEIKIAQQLGLDKNLPIFITETGWRHNGNGSQTSATLTPDQVARYFQTAFTSVWNDPRIIAVTPFILSSPHTPFDAFSWQKADSPEYYPQFKIVKDLPKTSGQPVQKHSAYTQRLFLPDELITNKIYQGELVIQNTGQSIWQTQDILLAITENSLNLDIRALPRHQAIEPYQSFRLPIRIETSDTITDYPITWQLSYAGQTLASAESHTLNVKPPNVVTSFKLWLYQSIHQQSFHTVD